MKNNRKIILVLLTAALLASLVAFAACESTGGGSANTAHTHDYVWVTSVAPNCKTEGVESYECRVCGDIKETRSLAKTDHIASGWTIGEDSHSKTCLVCGAVFDSGTHDYQWQSSAASCSSQDLACTACGHVKESRTTAEGHTLGEWLDTGTEHYRYCSTCKSLVGRAPHDTKGENGACSVCGIQTGFVCNEEDFTFAASTQGDGFTATYKGTDAKVIFPAVHEDQPVVAASASGNTSVEYVIVPEGVRIIDISAFGNCTNLKGVYLPEGITSFRNNAFYNNAIKVLEIPSTVTSFASIYFTQGNSFSDNIEGLVFRDGFTGLDDANTSKTTSLGRFIRMASLQWVMLPKSMTYVGINTFNSDNISIYFNGTEQELHNASTELKALTHNDIFCHSPERAEGNWYYNEDGTISARLYKGTDCILTHNFLNEPWYVSGYKGAGGHVDVPVSRCHLAVDHIGDYAFESKPITSITIPEGITAIGVRAFNSCKKLLSVHIPDSVTKFYNFGTYDENHWRFEGNNVFADCTNLRSVTGMRGIREIPEQAFARCTQLRSVELPEGIEMLDQSAFSGCDSLREIKLPDTITVLNGSCFWGCHSLETIKLPDGLINVGEDIFRECENLKTVILPENLKMISQYMFSGCNRLEVLVVPGTIEIIGNNPFGLASVSGNAPYGQLKSIYFNGTEQQYENFLTAVSKISGNGQMVAKRMFTGAELHYYSETYKPGCWYFTNGDHSAVALWDETADDSYIEYEATDGGYAVTGYNGGNPEVIIPDAHEGEPVVAVNDGAFRGMYFIKNIRLPASVERVGEYAFSGTSVESIELPAALTEVGAYAFADCSFLTEVSGGTGLTAIPEGMFKDDLSLVKFTVGEQVATVGDYAFAGCASLDRFALPATVGGTLNSVFTGCSGLRSLIVNADGIGAYNFDGCSLLEWVVVGEKVEGIVPAAFAGLSASAKVYYEGEEEGWTALGAPEGVTPVYYTEYANMTEGRWSWNSFKTAPLLWEASKIHNITASCNLGFMIHDDDAERTLTLHEDDVVVIEYKFHYDRIYDSHDWLTISMTVTTDGGDPVRYNEWYQGIRVGVRGNMVTTTEGTRMFSYAKDTHPKLWISPSPTEIQRGDVFYYRVTMRGDGQILYIELERSLTEHHPLDPSIG